MSYYYLLLCINIEEVDGGFMNEIVRKVRKGFGLPESKVLNKIDDEELKYIIYNLNRYISARQQDLKKKEAQSTKRSKDEYADIYLLSSYGIVIATVMFTVLIICAKMNFYPDFYFNMIVSGYFKKKKIHYEIEALNADLALYDKLVKIFREEIKWSDAPEKLENHNVPDNQEISWEERKWLNVLEELEKHNLPDNLKKEYIYAIEKKVYGRNANETLTEGTIGETSGLDMLIKSRAISNQQHASIDSEIDGLFYNVEEGTACINKDSTNQSSVYNQYKKAKKILSDCGEKCGEAVPGSLFDKFANMVWSVTDGAGTIGELAKNLCKLLCECFRYFALIGIDPSELIRTSVSKYDYSGYTEKLSKYVTESLEYNRHK